MRGSFNEFEGSGYFDADDPARSRLDITIKAHSIDTRNADRDARTAELLPGAIGPNPWAGRWIAGWTAWFRTSPARPVTADLSVSSYRHA